MKGFKEYKKEKFYYKSNEENNQWHFTNLPYDLKECTSRIFLMFIPKQDHSLHEAALKFKTNYMNWLKSLDFMFSIANKKP